MYFVARVCLRHYMVLMLELPLEFEPLKTFSLFCFAILKTRLCLTDWCEILTAELSSSDHKPYAAL